MRAVRPEEIMKILEVTDSLNLHRERIFIPLKTEQNGSATTQQDGRIRIVCPDASVTEEWLSELRNQLSKIQS